MRSREGKEEILGKGKYFLCGGGGREVKKEKNMGKRKKTWRRRKTETEKEENIWRREIFGQ